MSQNAASPNAETLDAQDRRERAEKALAAANEAAHTVSNLYITFLLLGTYIGIIIASTTDEQLLRIDPVTLPLLNVQLPIRGFYIFVPWLFLLFHFELLLQFALLGHKLHVFDEFTEGLPDVEERMALRKRLSNFPFVHMLAGQQHNSFLRWLLALVVKTTVVALPLMLLLWAQIAFLRYHDPDITCWQRAAVVLDAGILAIFWGKIVSPQGAWIWLKQRLCRTWAWCPWLWAWLRAVGRRVLLRPWQPPPGFRTFWDEGRTEAGRRGAGFLIVATLCAVFTSLLIATVPDEPWEQCLLTYLPKRWVVEDKDEDGNKRSERRFFWPTYVLFETEDAFFHRNLELGEKVLTVNKLPAKIINALRAGEKAEREHALQEVLGIDLQDRDLRNAELSKSILPKADLRGAQLQGAALGEAQLQGAHLAEAQLQGAYLFRAQLQGARLAEAQLQNADLIGAILQGADLGRAQLQGARLAEAQLQNADLSVVLLGGADLSGARLQGADLIGAILQGADLGRARLQVANLSMAWLQGTDLRRARLQGADLGRAQLQGADLREARIGGADFEDANLDFTDLRDLDRKPLTEEAYQKLSQHLEREIHDTGRRALILARLKTSIGKEDTLKKTTSAAQCLSGEPKPLTSCITNEADFNKVLVSYLVELVCDDPDVARSVVQKALAKDIFERKSTAFAELAIALLEANCEAVKKLPEDIQKSLRQEVELKKSSSPSQNR